MPNGFGGEWARSSQDCGRDVRKRRHLLRCDRLVRSLEWNADMSENTSKGSRLRMAIWLVMHAVCGLMILRLLLVYVPS